MPLYSDRITRLHLQELRERINNAVKDFPNSWMMLENSRQPTKSSGKTGFQTFDDELNPSFNTENCWEQSRLLKDW
jgi:hypothetical protein